MDQRLHEAFTFDILFNTYNYHIILALPAHIKIIKPVHYAVSHYWIVSLSPKSFFRIVPTSTSIPWSKDVPTVVSVTPLSRALVLLEDWTSAPPPASLSSPEPGTAAAAAQMAGAFCTHVGDFLSLLPLFLNYEDNLNLVFLF